MCGKKRNSCTVKKLKKIEKRTFHYIKLLLIAKLLLYWNIKSENFLIVSFLLFLGTMSLWNRAQQLPPDGVRQVQAIYGEQFPIEVRHYLAPFIEENMQGW